MIGALLCRAGRHDPDPAGCWNGGYCFTRCRRCGRDMVRSAFGEWRVPRGFRVVWGPKGSVADLDKAMGEARRPAADPSPTAKEPTKPRPTGAAPARSPFDFGDFDQEQRREPNRPPPIARRVSP